MTSPNIEYACSLCKHKAEDDEQMFIVTSEHVKYTVGTAINNAEAPFEGDRVDAIVGFAAHEAGHRLRSKDNIPINNHTNPFNTGNPLNPLSIYPEIGRAH